MDRQRKISLEAEYEALNYVYHVCDKEATHRAVAEVNALNGGLKHLNRQNPKRTYAAVVARVFEIGKELYQKTKKKC